MLTTLLLALQLTQSPPPKPIPPPPVSSFRDWFQQGKLTGDLRLRYEYVEDDGFTERAQAGTLRTRTGFRTAALSGVSVYLEGESVYALKEDYNSTANRRASFPTVADPEGSEINQAYVAYGLNTPTQVILGRQRINYDNQRFFGSVGFRQNEQTFDALSLQKVQGDWNLKLAYLDEVHRVFGNSNPNPLLRQQDLDALLVNVGYTVPKSATPFLVGHVLSAYAYLVKNADLPLSSASTAGLRYVGGRPWGDDDRISVAVEFATQQDYRGGSSNIDANYSLLEVGFSFDNAQYTVKFAQETLGGNGRYAFQTPFATLHAFNGWADRFLVTPLGGLRDRYLDAGMRLGPGALSANWHVYDSDQGSIRYGHEYGMQYLFQYSDKLSAALKYADYSADQFAKNTQKAWFFVDYKY